MATIQKRKNKNGKYSYKAIVRVNDGYPPDYKSFPTRKEASDWATQIEASRRQGSYFPEQVKAKHTLADLIDRYLSILQSTKPKSVKDIVRHLEWWKKRLGKYAVRNITADLIAGCRQELAEGSTYKGTMRSPSTVNRYLASLSGALTYCVRECGWIHANPCLRVTKLKESEGRDRVASEEECLKIFQECQKSRNKHLYVIVMLAITTGMRRGEVSALKWEHIDLENEVIFLKNTKNGKPRSIPIPSFVLDLLEEKHSTKVEYSPYVFPAKKRFGHICIRKAWEEVLKRAGIENLRFHDLRHTFATYAAEEGASNLELGTAMGHRTLQMLQKYTHMGAKSTRRFSEAIQKRVLQK